MLVKAEGPGGMVTREQIGKAGGKHVKETVGKAEATKGVTKGPGGTYTIYPNVVKVRVYVEIYVHTNVANWSTATGGCGEIMCGEAF